MNNYIIWNVLVFVSIFLLLFEVTKFYRNKAKKLEKENAGIKQNLTVIVSHSEELAGIKNDKENKSNEIRKAKSQEELDSIVRSIIDANNERVQNNSKH